ncbi:MAG: hypothetical protein A2W61_08650 [Deltaproteobacteria bacterium RIFCSPLOWO2_01_44_7]|nr:MAG: hypothetical protein A2712_08350 [Deltaproteobacteria bacterium RIFCSPHIGHO2_01_FULL_43_49]OGQ14652.1 MAG: hypothetical protein A3D22_08650 [Deltaproteobacteria bacterium RIFCSPHIGHO2_02_FULL_44_53]OGQ28038.1 MAG: hypothetical protein A3D98_07360 [Deltaproteobacteria bacterium RIFCSPHIGHO2_12_FULL_44_21]OGQ31250.1 MAG: hypothetical protein A2979_07410 [Deltaproteobacteria bacterium RIFCSPLOWO2_01_FULL_45_74]OGQ41483.1 MAG: hypothetical protein A2W61_08650 [Deltaproteobacteria bacterium 
MMKKFLCCCLVIIVLWSHGCGGGGNEPGDTSGSPNNNITNQTPPADQPTQGNAAGAETVFVPKMVTTGGSASSNLYLYVLEKFKTVSRLMGQRTKDKFFRGGGIFRNVRVGQFTIGPVLAPALFGFNGSNYYAAIDFDSFTGCFSSGSFHWPTISDPLSLTFFIGRSPTNLERVASACLTRNHTVAGTVWVDLKSLANMITGEQKIESQFVMKATLGEMTSFAFDSFCPYVTCKKYGLKFFSENLGKFSGAMYLLPGDWRETKVISRMDLAESTSSCFLMNGLLITAQNNGVSVSGTNQVMFGSSSGLSAPICSAFHSTVSSVFSGLSAGVCGIINGDLIGRNSACSATVTNNISLAAPSLEGVETEATFPSTAPTSFVPVN